ncbi:DUF1611 domain-containing protein [Aquipuribacter nitratireducens]|uniref:DUF1611 domain-containing protein n=1 Tax=Aquipuribacter nitratireducens TaxID=650104 RepID=A0ABW0GM67_9MICO
MTTPQPAPGCPDTPDARAVLRSVEKVVERAAAPTLGERLRRAKLTYASRHVVPLHAGQPLALLTGDDVVPAAGDLVLARVTSVGQHTWVELPTGRHARVFAGDEVVLAYADRYAPDAFLAHVPEDLGPCDLVAAGGIAARVDAAHASMAAPTRIEPVGLLADGTGRRLRLRDWTTVRPRQPEPATADSVPVVAVVGTAMNAGKTTALAMLVAGLSAAGLSVGAAKVTGTAAGNDPWLFTDAGAEALDFTDAGHPTTAGVAHEDCVGVVGGLLAELRGRHDVVVMEIADGVLQRESAALVADPRVRAAVDGVLFAAGDAVGALGGAERLAALGWRVLGVTGLFTASPLAVRETEERAVVPVLASTDLAQPEHALALLARLRADRGTRHDGLTTQP